MQGFPYSCEIQKEAEVLLRMSILQITSSQPSIYVRNTSQSLRLSSKPHILPVHAKVPLRNSFIATRNASIQQQCIPILKNQQCRAVSMYQQSLPVCLLGGKGKNGSDDEVRDISFSSSVHCSRQQNYICWGYYFQGLVIKSSIQSKSW